MARDRAVAIRDGERRLAEQDDRADGLAAVHDRRDDRRAQRAVAAVAAVPPADRQPRDAPLDHRVDGAGRRGQPGAVVVGAEAGVREHALAVAHRHRGVAEPLARLVGEHLRAGRVEAAAQRAAHCLDVSRMAAAGAWPSGTTRPKAARTRPSQATSASVVSATIGHEPAEREPLVLQHAQHDEQQQRLNRGQSGADHQRARAPRASGARPSQLPVAGRSRRRPGSRCCGRARSRAHDSAGLAQRVQLGQRPRVDDVVARRSRATGHEDPELLVVERGDAVGVGRDHELDARGEREAGVRGPQVEPVRLRVDLEERAVRRRRPRRPPRRRMRSPRACRSCGPTDGRSRRRGMLGRRQEALRHAVGILPLRDLQRGDDPVELARRSWAGTASRRP